MACRERALRPYSPSVRDDLRSRRAHADVAAIRRFIDFYAPKRILLDKPTVTLYEDVQEFVVAEVDGEVVGCGALHVLWADLAEVRTLAVDPAASARVSVTRCSRRCWSGRADSAYGGSTA